jgi:hypothetical protein
VPFSERRVLRDFDGQSVLRNFRKWKADESSGDLRRLRTFLAPKVLRHALRLLFVVCDGTLRYRYFNEELHPKPACLKHPDELWKHTAFENAEE